MNKRFIYFLTGALLCGLVLVVLQVTRAAGVAPNPGHALSCHIITAHNAWTANCASGTATGGGCSCNDTSLSIIQGYPNITNGWYCNQKNCFSGFDTYVVCCLAG